NFDDMTINRYVGHSFQNLPSGILAAKLEIRMKPLCANPENDSINLCLLGYSGTVTAFGWSALISDLSTAGTWACGQSAETFCLDLAALRNAPCPRSILDCINANGQLDVMVQDDTAIDYMRLSLLVCPCSTTPRSFQAGKIDSFSYLSGLFIDYEPTTRGD